jgi:hypothetical protein
MPARQVLDFEPFEAIDKAYWRDYIERSSRIVKRFPEVKNSWVDFRVRDVTRLFVNTEGSQIIDQTRVCDLSCDLWLLTEKGEGVATRVIMATPELGTLPDLKTFIAKIKERIRLLQQLAKAPTLKSYVGPVLLAPGAGRDPLSRGARAPTRRQPPAVVTRRTDVRPRHGQADPARAVLDL